MTKICFLKFDDIHDLERKRVIDGFNGQRGVSIMNDLRSLCIENDLPAPSCFQFEQEERTKITEGKFLWKTISNAEIRCTVSVSLVFKQEKIPTHMVKTLRLVLEAYSAGVRRGFIHGAKHLFWY